MVIDFHVHCFNPKVAERAIAKLESYCGVSSLTRGYVEQTIALFDKWGVDKGVLLPIATKPSQHKILNEWCAEQDGGRLISFGSFHPDCGDPGEELDKLVALGLHGIKLHPDYQGFFIDEERMDPIYDEIEKRSLPLILHTGYDALSPNMIHSPPERTANFVKKHPHMKIILAHMGGNMQWEEALELVAGLEGEVYMDTAFGCACPDEMMEKLIRKHGADRILLASDCPWDNTRKVMDKLERLHLTDGELEKIYGLNAQRLLGL